MGLGQRPLYLALLIYLALPQGGRDRASAELACVLVNAGRRRRPEPMYQRIHARSQLAADGSDAVEQLGNREMKAVRNGFQVVERDALPAAFKIADKAAIHPEHVGKLTLRPMLFPPQHTKAGAKAGRNMGHGLDPESHSNTHTWIATELSALTLPLP